MNATERIDFINMISLVVSAIAAIIIPFELFLFVYAILGPLHYLTEISWLHDRKYYTTGKNDFIVLILAAILLIVCVNRYNLGLDGWGIKGHHIGRLVFIALGSALVFAFVKKPIIKWSAVVCLVLISAISDDMLLFTAIFVPTLVHVYLFTFFFMLYGSLKSRSAYGYIGVALHLLFPFLLLFALRDMPGYGVSEGVRAMYESAKSLNTTSIRLVSGIGIPAEVDKMVFEPGWGLSVMRFIAFAYTYHYLNWFTKTEIIRWHKVPKARFVAVIGIWLLSMAFYLVDYQLALKWLVFLSLLHVFLEFPLNFVALRNIFLELKGRIIAG